MYRIDLPVDDDGLVERVLQALAFKYDDDVVKIDLKVYNPARIWKLYGTWARKGDNTPDRPHRKASILRDETSERLEVVSKEQLDDLALKIPQIQKQGLALSRNSGFNIETWIQKHKLPVKGPRDWSGGRLWVINPCPWNEAHTNNSAYIVELPNGAIGAGCHHSGCAGKDWHALRDIVEPGWRKKTWFASTDYGNAERLVVLHGDDLHYCHPFKKWFVWNGKRWKQDDTGEVIRRAKMTVRSISEEASKIEDDDKRKQKMWWALNSEGEKRIKSMIQLAQTELPVPVVPAQLDADPWLLNVLNGTIDLRSGKLQPHRREDLITKLAPVEWRGLDESLDLWDRFLDETTNGDDELKTFLQLAAGYSLTGDISEEVLYFVHGPAASGKSTFVEALKTAFGDYASTADFDVFLKRRDSGGPRNDIARLAGSRFVASIEVEEGKALAEGLIKSLTGGDVVAARFLYQEAFEFMPSFKLWLVANHAPKVAANDAAMWRRILRVPFEQVVPEERRDPTLKAKLRDPGFAGPAVLAWTVRGSLLWQNEGMQVPDCVKAATQEYREEMDPLRDFFED